MTETQTFAEIVEKARFCSRKNQSELAEELGISKSYMSELVSGKKPDSEGIFAKRLLALCDEEPQKENPLLNPYFDEFTIQGGMGTGDGTEQALTPTGYMGVPGIKRSPDVPFFQVKGDSMLNTDNPRHSIPQGAWIALKRAESEKIRWGDVYAFETAIGPMVKKIEPSEKEGCIKCVSFNRNYQPFDLDKSEIIDGTFCIVMGVVDVQAWY